MVVELMFIPIMERATNVQRKRERESICLTGVYSQVVVHNIHTYSKPDVSELRHYNTVDLP
jgi:hypothetical protein